MISPLGVGGKKSRVNGRISEWLNDKSGSTTFNNLTTHQIRNLNNSATQQIRNFNNLATQQF